MKIKCTEVSNAYIKESINVALMKKRLIRNPNRRIRNNFLIMPAWCIFTALMLVCFIILSLPENSVLWGVLIGCTLILEIIMIGIYITILKMYHKLKKKNRHSEYNFSADGIEYDNHENRKIASTWDSFQCLKVCKTGVFLIPNDETGVLYGFQIEKSDAIVRFFFENEIDIRCCP